MSAVVYRAFSPDGRLLYVGLSTSVGQRLVAHQQDKDWWCDVASVTLTHFETRGQAAEAEVAAIRDENPVHNVVRQGTPPDPRALDERRARRIAERDERVRLWREREQTQWQCEGVVACANCGHRPTWLQKGVLVAEQDCERCGCPGLELASHAHREAVA